MARSYTVSNFGTILLKIRSERKRESFIAKEKERTRDQERFGVVMVSVVAERFNGIGIRVCVVVHEKREKGLLTSKKDQFVFTRERKRIH